MWWHYYRGTRRKRKKDIAVTVPSSVKPGILAVDEATAIKLGFFGSHPPAATAASSNSILRSEQVPATRTHLFSCLPTSLSFLEGGGGKAFNVSQVRIEIVDT